MCIPQFMGAVNCWNSEFRCHRSLRTFQKHKPLRPKPIRLLVCKSKTANYTSKQSCGVVDTGPEPTREHSGLVSQLQNRAKGLGAAGGVAVFCLMELNLCPFKL